MQIVDGGTQVWQTEHAELCLVDPSSPNSPDHNPQHDRYDRNHEIQDVERNEHTALLAIRLRAQARQYNGDEIEQGVLVPRLISYSS